MNNFGDILEGTHSFIFESFIQNPERISSASVEKENTGPQLPKLKNFQ